MRRTLSGLAALALSAALIAANNGSSPAATTIESLDVTTSGGTLSLAGVVDYGASAPITIATDPAGDSAVNPETSQFGLDVVGITAIAPDGDEPLLTIVWKLARLDQQAPPEGMRWYYQATVTPPGQQFPVGTFAFQAKTTDFVSAANLGDGSPESVAANVADYANQTVPSFRIRGNCGTIAALNNCGHVAWVSGEFDFDDDEIRFHLPLDLANAVPVRPGSKLGVADTYASVQAAVDVVQTRDTVTTNEITIPSRTATARLLGPGGAVVSSAALSIGNGEGVSTVAGSLNAPGAGTWTLEVQACFGGNCATSTRSLTTS